MALLAHHHLHSVFMSSSGQRITITATIAKTTPTTAPTIAPVFERFLLPVVSASGYSEMDPGGGSYCSIVIESESDSVCMSSDCETDPLCDSDWLAS